MKPYGKGSLTYVQQGRVLRKSAHSSGGEEPGVGGGCLPRVDGKRGGGPQDQESHPVLMKGTVQIRQRGKTPLEV